MSLWLLLTLISAVMGQNGTKVCSSVDIRNKPYKLDVLRGCRVVEGYVQIVLMERGNEIDFNKHSLPDLREITEYLLFYRVVGLRNIGQIFPNLAIIRGESLFEDYALVVYEMFNLQEIGLNSLTDIVRGAVRIEKNPRLCYVQTIDWDRIARWDPLKNYISNNKDSAICPGCDSHCPQGLCWSRNHCQVQDEAESSCHPLCAGSCSGPGPKGCHTCRKLFTSDNECVEECPPGTFSYLNRRCITMQECLSISVPENNKLMSYLSDRQVTNFFIFNGTCIDHCPAGYELDAKASGCVLCHNGKCSKHCLGGSIDSISGAQTFRGCTHIDGSLEISIKTGKSKIIAEELEKCLGSIEEIKGCLKIVRSIPIVNLHFLKNLKVIHGDVSDNYAMLVLDNQNLQELWDWDKKLILKILKNRLFFHYNPKLCLHHILKLIEIVEHHNVTNIEVSKESNGDKYPCDVETVQVSVVKRLFNVIQIHIPYLKTVSQNSFLRYEVHYIKDPGKNMSRFDDLSHCSEYGWMTKDISLDLQDKDFQIYGISVNLTEIEPNEQYAYYVSAYTVDRVVAMSHIHYETTLPTTPSELVAVKVYSNSSSEITVSWEPPRHINGKLEEFVVMWALLYTDESLTNIRDYCEHPMTYVAESTTAYRQSSKRLQNKTSCCSNESEQIPKEGYEKLCSNFDRSTFPFGFSDIDPSQTCESFFNKFLFHRNFKVNDESVFQKSMSKSVQDSGNISFFESKLLPKNKYENKNGSIKNVMHLPATSSNFTISNVKHFKDYVVVVKACREHHPEETDDSEDYRCSKADIVSVRTQKNSDADLISKSIYHKVDNRTLYVSWEEPLDPNGLIVAFELEYRQSDVLDPKAITYCLTYLEYKVNQHKYAVLDLLPGKYEFRIRTVTLAGKGPYTKFISFTVSKDLSLSEHIIITLFGIFVAFILLLGIISLKYLQKKKVNLDNILITSVNPQYHYPLDHWELKKEDIIFGRELGFGTFGKVYEGILLPSNIPCAVKTVSENTYEKNIFLNEVSIMKSVTGAYHIVQLLGVMSREKPPLVVMELLSLGDLRSYLISVRANPPSEATILRMAAEIADGMYFMETKKFVHRDLAARNCLVSSNLTVKVGDFGMTRDIYETDYYRKGDKGLLPIRWMAPESLKDGLFSSHSDVWSYGVVLWEIVMLGEQPYQGLSNKLVLREVMSGRIGLDIPEHSPCSFKTLMRSCWRTKPVQRTCFLYAVQTLEQYVDDAFKRVSFYHSEEAVQTRQAMFDYVNMIPLEEPLLSGEVEYIMNRGMTAMTRLPIQKFSLKLQTVPEDLDLSDEDTCA